MRRSVILLYIFLLLPFLQTKAQEAKFDYERPNLNKVAPDLQVEEWLSRIPDTEDKFVLLDFWATYCGPCRESMPLMEKIAETYKDDLVVIGMAIQSPATVKEISGQDNIRFSYYSAADSKKRTYKACQCNGIPHILIIDPNGIVRWEGKAVADPYDKGNELTLEKVGEVIKQYKPRLSADEGFAITGKINGHYYDTLTLTTSRDGKMEIIARAQPTEEQTFRLQGKLNEGEICLVQLHLNNTIDYLPFFISNGNTVEIGLNPSALNNSKIQSDGAPQQLAEEFYALYDRQKKEIERLQRTEMPKFAAIIASGKPLVHEDSLQLNAIMERFDRTNQMYDSEIESFIKSHPDQYVTAYVLAQHIDPETDLENVKKNFSLLGQQVRESDIGRYIAGYIEKQERFSAGKNVPDFTLPTIDGDTLTLSKIPGKLKLVDFWASWCGPCRAENPNVVALYREYKDKGLTIIGVSLDKSKMAWKKAVTEDGISWLQVSDLKGWKSPVVQSYGVEGVPCTFLLDEQNRIVAVNLRGEALKLKIQEILEKN